MVALVNYHFNSDMNSYVLFASSVNSQWCVNNLTFDLESFVHIFLLHFSFNTFCLTLDIDRTRENYALARISKSVCLFQPDPAYWGPWGHGVVAQ